MICSSGAALIAAAILLVYRGPGPLLRFFVAHATLFIAFFYMLCLTLLLVGISRFISLWHSYDNLNDTIISAPFPEAFSYTDTARKRIAAGAAGMVTAATEKISRDHCRHFAAPLTTASAQQMRGSPMQHFVTFTATSHYPQPMKSVFNWSGGKDSSLCLYHVLQEQTYEVAALLTTLSSATQRISMHGVRQELLEQQAKSIGLPLQQMLLPENASMSDYNSLMMQTMHELRQQGITTAIFGDINLQDLREYREQQMAQAGLKAVFPLWNRPTGELVREFLDLGFKAVVVCVNGKLLDSSFAGRLLDEAFLQDLPPNVDPCGENGEFHTFVFDGPIFREPVKYTLGEVVHKTYGAPADPDEKCFSKDDTPTYDTSFWFCDLLPA